MPTRAAREFIQRETEYNKEKDGLNFEGWYDVFDLSRIVWKKFAKLSPEIKKTVLQPHVFIHSLDGFTLERTLTPLINTLQESSQSYFPFLFAPEKAGVHFMGGFLRKNSDKTISIILFNPTGTAPRIDYGDFAYQFKLKEDEDDDWNSLIEKNTLHFNIQDNALHYTLFGRDGFVASNSFNALELKEMGIVLDLNKPLTIELLQSHLKPKMEQILERTYTRGETVKKIEIISSTRKVQTSERDGKRLSSCGPLSLAFVDYAMSHPEYMAQLDKSFQLPDSINLEKVSDDAYKKRVMELRQQHYQVLDTITDEELDSRIIDASYAQLTDKLLDSKPEGELETSTPDEWDEAPVPTPQSEPSAVGIDPKPSSKSPKAAKDQDDEPKNRKSESETTRYIETVALSTSKHKSSPVPKNRELDADVQFVRNQIKRFRDNAKCLISFNNNAKADAIEKALDLALTNKVDDVRRDQGVKDALAIHRIFGFFGYKSTHAIQLLEQSLATTPKIEQRFF